ncbi:MAG TPA: NPCBM/NEW2 domain-containing protein [Pirellulales bacterium]|nr:NPCBM/NEW2 domain-containing protein [Pirellulales bacterium]
MTASGASAADERRLITVDGKTSQAAFVSAAPDGSWTFKTADSKRNVRVDDVVVWGAPAECPVGPVIFLADGGMIAQSPNEPGQVTPAVRMVQDRLDIERTVFGPLSLPLESVRGVMFQPPSERQERDQLARRITDGRNDDGAPREGDLLILQNGDELVGTVESCDGRHVHLASGVGKVRVEVAKLAALRFDPSLVAKPVEEGLRTIVGLANGSRVVARPFACSAEVVQVVPSIFKGKQAAWSAPVESLVFLQSLGGKVTYLSDLKVESYKHIPYLTLAWPYYADLNATGTQLRAGGRLYAKGIGMHSASRITVKLDKPYRRFEAELAIDDSTQGRGSVTCRVFVDDHQAFTSEIIRGGAPPVPIRVELGPASRLSLIVDFAERADEQDHADWLNARLVE